MAGATLAETFPRAALLAEDRLEVAPAVVGGPGVLELVRNGSTLLLRRRDLVLGGVYRVQVALRVWRDHV